jgi:hypothetical protein
MTLYQGRKPVKQESNTKRSRAWFYDAQKRLLKARCGGMCEWCGTSLWEQGGDADHLWGREGTGARLGFPFCHLVECLAALCRPCHEKRPTDIVMASTLRWRSVHMLAKRFAIESVAGECDDLIAVVRDVFARSGATADEILEGLK